MSVILGVWSPKGGVGKTTTAVNLAAIAAEQLGRVVLVDADENESAAEWVATFPDSVPVEVVTEHDPGQLARLRNAAGVDLFVVDLPGAKKTGEARELIGRGAGKGRAVVDGLVMPAQPSVLDLRVLARAIRSEIEPAGVPYRVLLTLVGNLRPQVERAGELRDEFREAGWHVCTSMIRRYVAHADAVAANAPITGYGGRHSYARIAESDYRAVAREIFGGMLDLKWPADDPEPDEKGR